LAFLAHIAISGPVYTEKTLPYAFLHRTSVLSKALREHHTPTGGILTSNHPHRWHINAPKIYPGRPISPRCPSQAPGRKWHCRTIVPCNKNLRSSNLTLIFDLARRPVFCKKNCRFAKPIAISEICQESIPPPVGIHPRIDPHPWYILAMCNAYYHCTADRNSACR